MVHQRCLECGRCRSAGLAMVFAGSLVMGSGAPAIAAETRTYVVSWFVLAAYLEDGNCPAGLNPDSEAFFRRDLKAVGEAPEKIDEIMNLRAGAVVGGSSTPAEAGAATDALIFRGRTNGKPTHAYYYPGSVPDAHIHTIESKYAYGFNLDGKGADSPNAFEDPESHEKGVNNQYFRAVGCHGPERPSPTDTYSTMWAYAWGNLRQSLPAWIISVSGNDLSKDGEVTVSIDKAMEHAIVDVNSKVMPDKTFRIDPDPRWHNTYRAVLKAGEITTQEPGAFKMLYDPYWVPEFDVKHARLRLTLRPDGTLTGVLGGYEKWRSLYFAYASFGINAEDQSGLDVPGTYHALKRLADAEPDPKTGENTRISTAFRIEAVPAFAVPLGATQVSQAP